MKDSRIGYIFHVTENCALDSVSYSSWDFMLD